MDLLESFSGNNHGLSAYEALRKRCAEDMRPGAPDAALYGLIVAIIDDFIDYFDRMPIPSNIARDAHKEMSAILEEAATYKERATPKNSRCWTG